MLVGGIDTTTGQLDNTNITNNALHVVDVGMQTDPITSGTATLSWAASALVNSLKAVDITVPDSYAATHAIILANMSTVTGIDYRICNNRTLGGLQVYTEIYQTLGSLPKSTATVIEDCEDAWNEVVVANVTSAADATDKVVGSNSQKFTIAAAFTTGIIGSEVISATNLSKANGLLLRIKSDVTNTAGQIQILLDNTAECASPLETLNVPALTADAWTHVFLPFADPTALTAIISIGAKITADLGAQNIWIDDVKSVVLSTREVLVCDLFSGGVNARIEASNDTVLGANDAFSLYTQVIGL